jgi:DNA-binding Lrp family transcriptional regulator
MTYDVADQLVKLEVASEIYSTAGEFDIISKFHVDNETDIGLFVNDLMAKLSGVRDSRTIIAFKAFN